MDAAIFLKLQSIKPRDIGIICMLLFVFYWLREISSGNSGMSANNQFSRSGPALVMDLSVNPQKSRSSHPRADAHRHHLTATLYHIDAAMTAERTGPPRSCTNFSR